MMAMVITMNEIATRLYQAITEKGISYGELARLTAIPKSAIQRYATGTTDKIPLERLRALAAALCLPLSALTGWEENERSDERGAAGDHDDRARGQKNVARAAAGHAPAAEDRFSGGVPR